MKTLTNFVAVDWRAGKDRIYFFFTHDNTYSRFDIGDNAIPDEYPTPVNYDNWHDFHKHVKDLRFGFTTRNARYTVDVLDEDELWLFYHDQGIPMVCRYDQDKDKVSRCEPVKNSLWNAILPHFNDIVAGTWWEDPTFGANTFRFLTKTGHSLTIKDTGQRSRLIIEPINEQTWPGLAPYKHRMITAAQNDRTLADSYLYIFLTNNEYITYNIPKNKVAYGPTKVDEDSWPGLLRESARVGQSGAAKSILNGFKSPEEQ